MLKQQRWVRNAKILAAGAFILAILVLAEGVSTSFAEAREFRIALVLDKGGKDDKSFNSAAFQGSAQAKSELKAFLKYVEATDDNSFEPMLRAFAQKDFDLILSIGVTQKEALKKVAAQFPRQLFAIVDAEVNAPNVSSLLFEEHEGSYLMGAAAALATQTGKIGFIGGMDIPLIRRFQLGFDAGAKKISPSVKVTSNFIGITGDAWNNPAKAKELAVSQFDSGVDVIFSPSGASTSGVFDAAEERQKFAIGVDSNQNWVKPGRILTSMLKRVDKAVYQTCLEASQNKFVAGVKRFGLANEGVDFSVDQYNEKILTVSMRKKLSELKAQIVSGKIKVPDYYSKK